MRHLCALFIAFSILGSSFEARQQLPVVHVAVVGETSLKTNFIQDLRNAGAEAKIQITVTTKDDPNLRYTLIVAQETTISSAAAAVVVLDSSADVVTSVVRSGRMTARGALNACAKEIAKRLAVLAD